MQRSLKAKRIDMPDGSILYRNVYRVHWSPEQSEPAWRSNGSRGTWRGLAVINKHYTHVETVSTKSDLGVATWRTVRTS